MTTTSELLSPTWAADVAAVARTPFDPELKAGLVIVGGMFPPTVTPDLIGFMRQSYVSLPIDETLRDRAIDREDLTIAGHLGDPIGVSILRPRGASGLRPGILNAHSGGLMFGDRFIGIDLMLDWIEKLGVIIVTVEYRLAPEYPEPYPREDMYAALEWTAKNAEHLGIRLDRLMLAGASSGGGLAAGLALAARDRGGPRFCGQLLDYPMLDDRGITPSTGQFDGIGVWDRISNETGWGALLGAERGGPNVSEYAAPARARDLRNLPPAFIDVGAADIFRDESINYATGLWEAGGDAELHIWAGGFHAYDIFAPHTVVSRSTIRTRDAWVEKILAD